MWVGSERFPLCSSGNEELGTLADNNPLTGYEPNVVDNFHISETTEIFIQESTSDRRPSILHDWKISEYTIGRALSSPLFTQEREDPAGLGQAYHSLEESLLSNQSLSVGHVRTERLVSEEFESLISNVRENPYRSSENEQIRTLLERQREPILADCQAEIRPTRNGTRPAHSDTQASQRRVHREREREREPTGRVIIAILAGRESEGEESREREREKYEGRERRKRDRRKTREREKEKREREAPRV